MRTAAIIAAVLGVAFLAALVSAGRRIPGELPSERVARLCADEYGATGPEAVQRCEVVVGTRMALEAQGNRELADDARLDRVYRAAR